VDASDKEAREYLTIVTNLGFWKGSEYSIGKAMPSLKYRHM
jgi:hypothetical protein